ncbi:MAG TPA: hypothetical protein VF800_08080 [Telluria sp.]|jgi:hypothetical protein
MNDSVAQDGAKPRRRALRQTKKNAPRGAFQILFTFPAVWSCQQHSVKRVSPRYFSGMDYRFFYLPTPPTCNPFAPSAPVWCWIGAHHNLFDLRKCGFFFTLGENIFHL